MRHLHNAFQQTVCIRKILVIYLDDDDDDDNDDDNDDDDDDDDQCAINTFDISAFCMLSSG